MYHYQQHIGDWMKDTMHLSAEQEGIYGRLVQQYYNREGPLPRDLKTCQKLARCSTNAEREAVRFCLKEFFAPTPEGWRQKRCDKEIEKYQARAAHNREVGKLGGRPPNSTRNVSRGPEPGRVNSVNPEETQVVSKNNPSRKPLAVIKEKEEKTLASEQKQDEALRRGARGHVQGEPMRLGDLLPRRVHA